VAISSATVRKKQEVDDERKKLDDFFVGSWLFAERMSEAESVVRAG